MKYLLILKISLYFLKIIYIFQEIKLHNIMTKIMKNKSPLIFILTFLLGANHSLAEELTSPQKNAIKSAESYLSFSGFSRNGLIDQLSSDAGDGYDLDDAKIAVDSLVVNWTEQAMRSAEQYLSFSGFSRLGLIDQLSSDAGSKFELNDATEAVDNLSVDWNEQALRSAKQYLSFSGFSCSGLIAQLSADAGSKYTEAQATHGAQKAGAC